MFKCGVRQCSVLSSHLFNVFVNLFVVYLTRLNIDKSNVKCLMKSLFVGCLLYAMICYYYVLPSKFCDVCIEIATRLSLKFNCDKSVCIAIGKPASLNAEPLVILQSIGYPQLSTSAFR